MRRGATGALAACVLVAATVAGTLTSCGQVGSAASTGSAQVTCDAELRSWIVAGRGRHMYLEIGCPVGFDHLDGRVEYTFASMRRDYEGAFNEGGMPRVARMTRGIILFPLPGAPEPDHRLEKRYEITPKQAACLQPPRRAPEGGERDAQ